MPSRARRNFRHHPLRDVEMLRDLHRAQYQGQGRPYSVLTRSGIFLLCAAWELYCEEVIAESMRHMLDWCQNPLNLPEQARRTLVQSVKADKHELAALRLAGEGWKQYYESRANENLAALNTPSAAKVGDLFFRILGINVQPVLGPISDRLGAFITKRGDIAHRGAQAGHISINDLDADFELICNAVRDLDNFLIDPIRDIIGYRPWNRQN